MCLVLSDLVAYSTFGWGRSLYLFVVYSSKYIFGGGRDCQGTVSIGRVDRPGLHALMHVRVDGCKGLPIFIFQEYSSALSFRQGPCLPRL